MPPIEVHRRAEGWEDGRLRAERAIVNKLAESYDLDLATTSRLRAKGFGLMVDPSQQNDRTPKYIELEVILTQALFTQQALITNFSLEANGNFNKSAVGYVYGLIDCATQIARLEIDCTEGRSLIANVIDSLQDGLGRIFLATLEILSKDREFMDRVMLGGEQYNNWVKTNGSVKPFGLGRSFHRR